MCPNKGITDIRELMEFVNNYDNIITIPIFQRDRTPTGFKHPITGQVFTLTNDFYRRQTFCDLMYNEKHYDEFRFRNQSWLKLATLYMNYYKLGDFDDCLGNLSETDRQMYKNHPSQQFIGRRDDDKY
jgi:hypothetical protein